MTSLFGSAHIAVPEARQLWQEVALGSSLYQTRYTVVGAEIDVSPVMGKGFPVEKAPPAEFPYLFIFATGTGIGPIKALIASHALKVDFRGIPIKRTIAQGRSLFLACAAVCMAARCAMWLLLSNLTRCGIGEGEAAHQTLLWNFQP